MGRYALLVAVLLSGCAGMYVEDWELKYRNCEINLDWDEGEVACKWRI